VVVIDTPPSQHALEFFRAQSRVAKLLDGQVVDILTSAEGGLLSMASRKVAKLLLNLAGANVVNDIREFFSLFADLSQGIRARNRTIQKLLRSPQTSVYAVTTANNPMRRDGLEFAHRVQNEEMNFAGFLVNRVRPRSQFSEHLSRADFPPKPSGVTSEVYRSMIDSMLECPRQSNQVACRHQVEIEKLRTHSPAPVWTIPNQEVGPRNIAEIIDLSRHLPPLAQPISTSLE